MTPIFGEANKHNCRSQDLPSLTTRVCSDVLEVLKVVDALTRHMHETGVSYWNLAASHPTSCVLTSALASEMARLLLGGADGSSSYMFAADLLTHAQSSKMSGFADPIAFFVPLIPMHKLNGKQT